jgi:hypothetical protein
VVRTIGNDLHMDYSAVGHTTNLVSCMEQLAAPGSVTLTGATLRLVEGLVQINAPGAVPVKGMTEPVEVYELTGASILRRRLQAAVARGLTKFVGRETESEALNHARARTESGNGQVVAAVGEAGVGKSRLVYEFSHSHRTQGWLVLESASVSYGQATPYFPVVDLLKRYVHVDEGDDLRNLPPQPELQAQAIDLRLELRSAHMVLGETEQAFNALREAEVLTEALDDAPRLGRVSLLMAQYFGHKGAYDQGY